MMIGDEFNVFGEWFKIHFIENNGMAFGMASESGKTGKTLLSIFRIIAVAGIGSATSVRADYSQSATLSNAYTNHLLQRSLKPDSYCCHHL